MEKLFKIAGGFFVGGFAGWLIGGTWYFLIEVPYANNNIVFYQRDSYLCSAGNALPMLAIPGALLGAMIGLSGGLNWLNFRKAHQRS